MRKFTEMSRLAGIVNDEGRSLAHDIHIMDQAGNRESFAVAKQRAQKKIQELHAFVSQATFEESQADPLRGPTLGPHLEADLSACHDVGEFLHDVLRTGR